VGLPIYEEIGKAEVLINVAPLHNIASALGDAAKYGSAKIWNCCGSRWISLGSKLFQFADMTFSSKLEYALAHGPLTGDIRM
jgi:hypothetical protein